MNKTEKYFAPYSGNHPATVCINGHNVIIVAQDPEQLEDNLELVGGDRILPIDDQNVSDSTEVVKDLAEAAKAHVVLTPLELSVPDVLASLERDLPWLH